LPGIAHDRLGLDPAPAFELAEEAALAARVAGDSARLLDLEQHRVLVAVDAYRAHLLHVARFLALAPEPAARARPVVRLAGGDGLRERLAAHPREGQHLARRGVLRDRGHQAVRVPFHGVEPVVVHDAGTIA